jgi:hypothetical protein
LRSRQPLPTLLRNRRRNSKFQSKAKTIGRAFMVFGASGSFKQNRITEDEPPIPDKVSWTDVLSELRLERSRKILIKVPVSLARCA